jgi:hypothetical protein
MSAQPNEDDFETLAVALSALQRWQRRHRIAGKVTLTPRDAEASAHMLAGINADGYADVDGFLRTFSDVLDLRLPMTTAAAQVATS